MPNIKRVYQWNKEKQQWEHDKPTTKTLFILSVAFILMFSLVANIFLVKENKILRTELEQYSGQPYYEYQANKEQ